MDKKTPNNLLSIDYFIVFADEEQMSRVSALFLMDSTQSASYFYGFQPVGAEGDKDVFSRELEQYASGQPGFAQYRDYREQMSDEESMYGGLLFIGIFFGAIFLICLLIIMYYKQLTEVRRSEEFRGHAEGGHERRRNPAHHQETDQHGVRPSADRGHLPYSGGHAHGVYAPGLHRFL